MSFRSRLGLATMHLFEAAGEFIPLPGGFEERQQGLQFLRAVQGYQLSMAVGAGYEMGLYSFLSEPRTIEDIATHCKLEIQAANVLLDALMAAGLVCVNNNIYELSAVGRRAFLRGRWSAAEELVRMMLGGWDQWRRLGQVLQGNDGHPELRVYNPQNPLMGEYVRMTTAMLAGPSKELVRRLDLSNVKRMICGTVGISFAAAVLQAQPQAELTVSCLERLIAELPDTLKQFGLPEPAEVIVNSGEAEDDQWGKSESYDLIFLARKFAFCGPEHGISYLRKSLRVVPPGGYVILWEPFADNYEMAPWAAAATALVDSMLGIPQPLYRKEEVAEFAREAGYNPVSVIDTAGGGISFIVARHP